MYYTKFALAMALTIAAATPAMAEGGKAASQEHLKSLDANQIDNSIAPGTDFYRHVNKKWMDANPLTPEHARYGKFNILSDTSEARVKDIVLNLAATNPAPGTVAFKVSTIIIRQWTRLAVMPKVPSLYSPTSRKSSLLLMKV